jgi:predicted enzyme related to lactoylglutathione lyase
MITGIHLLTYAHDAELARAFFRDVLALPHVDAGEGWLIFKLPPAEVGVHPTEPGTPPADGQPTCELYLLCDDLQKTVAELERKGVEFVSPISEQPWGIVTSLKVPGAGEIGLYQPKHPMAIALK